MSFLAFINLVLERQHVCVDENMEDGSRLVSAEQTRPRRPYSSDLALPSKIATRTPLKSLAIQLHRSFNPMDLQSSLKF